MATPNAFYWTTCISTLVKGVYRMDGPDYKIFLLQTSVFKPFKYFTLVFLGKTSKIRCLPVRIFSIISYFPLSVETMLILTWIPVLKSRGMYLFWSANYKLTALWAGYKATVYFTYVITVKFRFGFGVVKVKDKGVGGTQSITFPPQPHYFSILDCSKTQTINWAENMVAQQL